MGIGTSNSLDEEYVRYIQELIHREYLGEIEPLGTITPYYLIKEASSSEPEQFSDFCD